MIATQFPSTVAGAIRVRICPASVPRTDEYIADRGTAPAVMPPLVIGIPIYRMPSRKLSPITIPSRPESITPTASDMTAVGSSFTVARIRSPRSILKRLPVISAEI